MNPDRRPFPLAQYPSKCSPHSQQLRVTALLAPSPLVHRIFLGYSLQTSRCSLPSPFRFPPTSGLCSVRESVAAQPRFQCWAARYFLGLIHRQVSCPRGLPWVRVLLVPKVQRTSTATARERTRPRRRSTQHVCDLRADLASLLAPPHHRGGYKNLLQGSLAAFRSNALPSDRKRTLGKQPTPRRVLLRVRHARLPTQHPERLGRGSEHRKLHLVRVHRVRRHRDRRHRAPGSLFRRTSSRTPAARRRRSALRFPKLEDGASGVARRRRCRSLPPFHSCCRSRFCLGPFPAGSAEAELPGASCSARGQSMRRLHHFAEASWQVEPGSGLLADSPLSLSRRVLVSCLPLMRGCPHLMTKRWPVRRGPRGDPSVSRDGARPSVPSAVSHDWLSLLPPESGIRTPEVPCPVPHRGGARTREAAPGHASPRSCIPATPESCSWGWV